MDYTRQPAMFKARKALRYLRLYGPQRTRVKIAGQYHMKRQYERLPAQGASKPGERHVGIVGCGNFAYTTIAYFLTRRYGCVVRAAMDIEVARAASLFASYDLEYYTTDFDRLVDDATIDLIYVASNHASHAEYAIQALRAGKHVHIEKPHVVDRDQLERLCAAMEQSSARVTLGFNRPDSEFGRLMRERLGAQAGAGMFNWFVAGHELAPDHWYYAPEEGGRILGNLCHWTDFVYHLVPAERRYPITVTPTRAEQADCEIAVSYVFGDDSVAAITFSAKGHAFEGVKERFAAHKGEVIVTMDDFRTLRIEKGARVTQRRTAFRDHGHERSIANAYALARPEAGLGAPSSPAYVWETADLFLTTRTALEERRTVRIEGPYAPGAGIPVASASGKPTAIS